MKYNCDQLIKVPVCTYIGVSRGQSDQERSRRYRTTDGTGVLEAENCQVLLLGGSN